MTDQRFRVGLIGYGRSGRDIHARTVKRLDKFFEIAAVSDTNENRRAQASAENDCPVYADYREMAARDDIDLYVNTAFSNLHVPISVDLLRRNKAVLCEKPLTNSMKEFEELASAIKETGSFFTSFHNLRYEPVFVKLREWLASGLIGEPLQITMTANSFHRRWDWASMRSKGGGILMMLGVHYLDLALQLAGADYSPDVKCCMKHHGIGDADNYAKVLLTSESGPSIDIECSYFDAFPRPRYHVQGTHGTILCTESKIEARYYDPSVVIPIEPTDEPLQNEEGNPTFCREQLPMETKTWEHNQNLYKISFNTYYERLYEALAGRGAMPVTLDELRQQVNILETCYRDAKF